MAYSLHIVIDDDEIDITDWADAVADIDGVKIDASDSTAVNPGTGEEISIASSEGDVSVLMGSEWVKCIYFCDGRATFNAVVDIESSNNPVHIAASRISGALGAKIIGDEGEVYEWSSM
jgi:hypothetical protein